MCIRDSSHDLRTPLTSISGNAGILMENGAVLDEEKRRYLYRSISVSYTHLDVYKRQPMPCWRWPTR